MNFSVGMRVAVLGAIGLLTTGAVSPVSYRGISTMQSLLHTVEQKQSAIRNNLEGDMMHEALRADVLASFLVQDQEAERLVSNDPKDHAEWLRTCMKNTSTLELSPSVKWALNAAIEAARAGEHG